MCGIQCAKFWTLVISAAGDTQDNKRLGLAECSIDFWWRSSRSSELGSSFVVTRLPAPLFFFSSPSPTFFFLYDFRFSKEHLWNEKSSALFFPDASSEQISKPKKRRAGTRQRGLWKRWRCRKLASSTKKRYQSQPTRRSRSV